MTIWEPRLDPDGPTYLAIARALEADVAGGRLPPGTRLPTHRDLAASLGVNVGTVSRAYAEARRRGLVHGEVGRGTFVRPAEGPALQVRERAAAHAVDLSVNVPLEEPAPDHAAGLRALARERDLAQLFAYRDPAGSPRARAAGATWLGRLGVPTDAERVVVCGGAQHAILVALSAVCGPGDAVLAESLTYPGFLAAARTLGLRARGVELDDEGLRPDSLAALCRAERPRLLYCMPSLHNPTTARWSEARCREVAAIAHEHDLALVQDEIQAGVGESPTPLARLAPEHVLTIASLSKTLAPGLRLAFLAAPQRHVARLAEQVWSTVWMASPLGAALAARWIEDGTAERVVAGRRLAMAARHAVAAEALAGLAVATRPGAYHVWLQLEPGRDASRFAEAARVRGVRVTPAQAFAVQPARAPAAVRISLSAARDEGELRRALAVLAELVRSPDPGRVLL